MLKDHSCGYDKKGIRSWRKTPAQAWASLAESTCAGSICSVRTSLPSAVARAKNGRLASISQCARASLFKQR